MLDIIRRRGSLALAVLLAGGLVAACGSGSSSSTTSTTAAASSSAGGGGSGATANAAGSGATAGARRTALRNCLKAHGVTLPARPPAGAAGAGRTPYGGGPPAGGAPGFGGGVFRSNPKVRAALQACGANFGARRFQLSHQAINRYVACIRQHGYNMPNPNFSGNGPVFPASIRSNPKFQAASRACQNLLVPPRPGGGTRTTTTSASA